jgi:hypothetical protein
MSRSHPPEPTITHLDRRLATRFPHEQDSGQLPGGGPGTACECFARKSAVLLGNGGLLQHDKYVASSMLLIRLRHFCCAWAGSGSRAADAARQRASPARRSLYSFVNVLQTPYINVQIKRRPATGASCLRPSGQGPMIRTSRRVPGRTSSGGPICCSARGFTPRRCAGKEGYRYEGIRGRRYP